MIASSISFVDGSFSPQVWPINAGAFLDKKWPKDVDEGKYWCSVSRFL